MQRKSLSTKWRIFWLTGDWKLFSVLALLVCYFAWVVHSGAQWTEVKSFDPTPHGACIGSGGDTEGGWWSTYADGTMVAGRGGKLFIKEPK